MTRRHGRMFLRGKPGLLMLVTVLTIGIFLAYYTFGRSSVKPNKYTLYKNARGSGKFPSYQIPKSNKGFSDMVFNKNNLDRQLPRPVLPKPNFGAQRNFGGMRKNEPQKTRSEDRDTVDDEYSFQDEDDKPGLRGDKNPRRPTSMLKVYTEPDESFSTLFKSMKRIVHLDLKGAFPKLDYLEKVLPLFQKLGATGLLVEYEDMFPYAGELSILAAENAYSMKDISRLLQLAKQNNLDVIPLVQTFGHMEFVLKHTQFQNLRETPFTPQVISPMHNESYALISQIIEQMLAAHPDAKYLHIGSDEVYDLGKGKTNTLIVGGKTKEEIMLQHMSKVAAIVKSKRTMGVIVWDDELRNIADKLIVKSGISNLVEPMVWCYNPYPRDKLPDGLWTKYGRLFTGIWAASAFKGATGSAEFYTNVSYHLVNHLSWVDIIKKMKNEMPMEKFRGMALTGWQRYDHFATLCELLPEAIPSLAVCLETIMNGGFSFKIHKSTSMILNCSSLIELGRPKVNDDHSALISQDCSFPGSHFYYSTQQLWGVLNQYNKDLGLQNRIKGWLTDYNVRHRFSSPGHLKILLGKLNSLTQSLSTLIDPVSESLNSIFDKYTVNEWVEVNLKQRMNRLNEKAQKAKMLIQQNTWARRPLPVLIPEGGVQVGRVGQNSLNAVQMQQDNQYNRRTKNPNEQQLPGAQNQFGPKYQQGQNKIAGEQNLADNRGQFQGGKGMLQESGNRGQMMGGNRMGFPRGDNQAKLPGFERNRAGGIQERLQGGNRPNPMVGNQGQFQGGNRLNPMIGNQGLKGGAEKLPVGGNQGQFQGGNRLNPMIGNQGLKDGADKLSRGGNQGQFQDGNRLNPMIGNQGLKGGAEKLPVGGNQGQFQDSNRLNPMIGNQGLKDGADKLSRGGNQGQFQDSNRLNPMIGNQERLNDGTGRLSGGEPQGPLQGGNRRNSMVGNKEGLRPLEGGKLVGDKWRNQGVAGDQRMNIQNVPGADRRDTLKKPDGEADGKLDTKSKFEVTRSDKKHQF